MENKKYALKNSAGKKIVESADPAQLERMAKTSHYIYVSNGSYVIESLDGSDRREYKAFKRIDE